MSANAVAPAQPWWVNLFGHNHPTIRAALIDQLHTLGHVMLAGFTHGQVVELSERLAARTGLDTGHRRFGKMRAAIGQGLDWLETHHAVFGERPTSLGFHLLAMWDHLAFYDLVPLRQPRRVRQGRQRRRDRTQARLAQVHQVV